VDKKEYGGQARPNEVLEREIMNSSFAKNDREWWAKREIEKLREQLANLQEQPLKEIDFCTCGCVSCVNVCVVCHKPIKPREQPREYCQCEKPYPSKVRCAICGKNIKPPPLSTRDSVRGILESLVEQDNRGRSHCSTYIDQALTELTPLFEPLERDEREVAKIIQLFFQGFIRGGNASVSDEISSWNFRAELLRRLEDNSKYPMHKTTAHAICNRFGRVKGKE